MSYWRFLVGKITGDRKVRTRDELDAAMKEPMGTFPTRYVWMHESLVGEARRLWEQMAVDLR